MPENMTIYKDPSALLVDMAAPNRRGLKSNVPIGQVLEKYEKENPWTSRKQKQNWKYSKNKCLKLVRPNTPISKIRYSDIKKTAAVHSFLKPIRWFLNGPPKILTKKMIAPVEIMRPSSNGHIEIKTKIKVGTVDMLADLMASSYGKHVEIVTEVRDAIAECPPNEIRIIEANEKLIADKKLRAAIMNAVNHGIKDKGWTVRWSGTRKVMFVARIETLKAIQKERKK